MLQSITKARPSDEDTAHDDGKRHKKRRFLVPFVRALIQFALMAAVIIAAYVIMDRLIAAKPERTARPKVDVQIPVQAVTITLGEQRPTINLFGEVAASRSLEIRPSVSGEIVSVNPDLGAGQRIEQGVELFLVDRIDFEAAVAEAKANLAQTDATIIENQANLSAEQGQLEFAESQLLLARADLKRADQLRKNGTLTQKEVDDRSLIASQREQAVSQRRNNIAVAQARLSQQQAVRERLELGVERAIRDLNNTVVRAPFSGVVRSSSVEIGRIVSANDVAVSIYDDAALDVRFTLTDAQYGRIAADGDPLIGRNVALKWAVGGTDYSYTGTVTRIGADIASERGGVDVFARIDENEELPVQLRPGAFVSIEVPDRLYENAARVPETAIFDSNTAYLIIDGKLQARELHVAAYDGSDAIVTAGLSQGDRILSTRISEIEEGLAVRIVDANGVAEEADEIEKPEQGNRPSAEVLAAAKKISGLSDVDWEALPRQKRRLFIQEAREAAGK
ncbi:efflux RND transporter periplasmic adaptor subunit [Ahrensia kielensis]|uniref:Efflux RND transporter periplasmic adaptor subunit n=1 Tax=Ahrensia kielensis TaxID=76980 RepID=A0ABU9T1K6_9HYPH